LEQRWLRSWKFKAREKVLERQIFGIGGEHVVEVGLVQIVRDNLRDV